MSIYKVGSKAIRATVYAKQQRQREDRAIYAREKKIEKRKHDTAREKLEKYRRGEINLTQDKIEKYQKDLEYKARTPEEVRIEKKRREQERHREYVNTIGKGKYICSQLFGNWVLFLGNKKGE